MNNPGVRRPAASSSAAIHQVLAGYADGDAISQQALLLRRIFRDWGYASDIYAESAHVSPSLQGDCRPLRDYAGRAGDICMHHFGIDSPAAAVFRATPAHKIMIYHNITPADYFVGFDDGVAAQLHAARENLRATAQQADQVWTVSQFNATELTALGLENVKIFRLMLAPETLAIAPDPRILGRLAGPLKNILFVGRIAPNKRLEDLILAFACYNKAINPYSRLIIVGSKRSAPRYYPMLRLLVGDLVIPNVCFEGFAAPAGRAAYYRLADLFISPSEHEGYCLPLLEAMHYDVPVIARQAGGMPEALQGAGIMYDGLAPEELAELMHLALSDAALRATVRRSQEERMRQISQRAAAAELQTLLAEYLPAAGVHQIRTKP